MKQINKETCALYVQEQKVELGKIVKANELDFYTVFIIQVGDEPASNSYIKGKIKV
jgi:5,10-methylene-tetrahydrofolate dehydrogenase/methenyl tetrahydrofolate cyclohydrolase